MFFNKIIRYLMLYIIIKKVRIYYVVIKYISYFIMCMMALYRSCSRGLYSYNRRRHAKYQCRRRSLSCAAWTRNRERRFFAHMCKMAILLCIDFTSDTAAPAGRVNIDVLYIHIDLCAQVDPNDNSLFNDNII